MRFWLGIHETSWAASRVGVPVMMSRRRLEKQRPRRCSVPWVMDSGGFTELAKFDGWTIGPEQYADDVRRWSARLNGLEWCAPQDWMCEPEMVERTGLSVIEHQDRTLANFVALLAEELPVIPVLQGYTLADYVRHVADYQDEGIDLTTAPLVGLGSVCRRENTDEIAEIVTVLHDLGVTRLHGFGCKAGALSRVGHILASADSMAWSKAGKERGPCTHLRSRCANHLHYALTWRSDVLASVGSRHVQTPLFVETS